MVEYFESMQGSKSICDVSAETESLVEANTLVVVRK